MIAVLAVTDLVAYLGALLLAAGLAAQPWLGAHDTLGYWIVIVLVLPAAAILFVSQGLYDPQNLLAGTREYAAVLRACTYGFIAIVLLSFVVHYPVARQWTVLSWVLSAALVGLARFGIRRVAHRLRRTGLFVHRILLVGADAQGMAVARQLSNPSSGIRLVGVLDDYLPAGSMVAGRLKVLGPSSLLAEAAVQTGIHEVIVVPQALPWESLHMLLARAIGAPDGLRIHLLGGFYDLLAAGVRLSERNNVPLLTIKKVALTPGEAVLKRMLDCALASGLLMLSAPIMALQVLLRWTKGLPVLERLPVFGREGKEFNLLKFSGDLADRSTAISKLPSLVNVLAGQLSIVGPHPISAGGSSDARQGNPFALRPGLTGLWRGTQDPSEQHLLDLLYIRGYSVWLDLQILFTRVRVRLRRPRPAVLPAEPDAVRLA